jgi:hypothetical protein
MKIAIAEIILVFFSILFVKFLLSEWKHKNELKQRVREQERKLPRARRSIIN